MPKFLQMELPFYTYFSPPPKVGLDTGSDSLVHQECREECDINTIMKKYARTGLLPNDGRIPLDGALMDMIGTDFQANMNHMIEARDEFDALPSAIRDRFGNNPAKLIAFLSDEANRDEAVRLGIIARTPALVAGEGDPASAGKGANVEPSSGSAS